MPRRIEKKPRRGQRDLNQPEQILRWEVGDPDHGQRLDRFLAERIRWRSRTKVREYIAEGQVEILPHKDPQRAAIGQIRDGLKLRWGQEVVLRVPEPKIEKPATDDWTPDLEAEDLQVVYEDEWIVAVNKPPHISVHPSKGHLTGSLIHLIHERHRRLFGPETEVPTLCHRLDRETSGLVLCAKDQLSRTRLGRQFEARTIQKSYLAVVVGALQEASGEIDLPLGRALTSEVRLKMGVRHDADGMSSSTAWKRLRSLPGRSLVELRPRTGRQHQLRVHLAAIGHPIVGDKLYLGGDEVFLRSVRGELTEDDRRELQLDRQALHSASLSFEHPMSSKQTTLQAPLLPDMEALLQQDDEAGSA